MDLVLLFRLLLGILVILLVGFLVKVNKAVTRERRVARYSLLIKKEEDLSFFDKLFVNYNRLVKKFQNNKLLVDYSNKYSKYNVLEDSGNAIVFVVNKLVVAIIFVVLIIISYSIQGKIISFLGAIFSFIFGYYIYDIYLFFRKKSRSTKIKNEMLRAVIIMNNAFKAGKSILQAVEIASHDLPKPISREFYRIYQDMSYGLSADVAFQRFAFRVELEEANYIASTLAILNKTGGNIVMVFSSIEKTLFDKKKLEEELKNATAASNLVVKVLMVIPIFFVLFIYVISPGYFEPLFLSGLGYFILFIMILMFSVYIYLLNKIMKVRV